MVSRKSKGGGGGAPSAAVYVVMAGLKKYVYVYFALVVGFFFM